MRHGYDIHFDSSTFPKSEKYVKRQILKLAFNNISFALHHN